MRLTAQEIVSASEDLHARLVQGGPQAELTGLSTDSRSVGPGQLFVALQGEKFDGHDFVAAALNRGAAGVLVRAGFRPAGGFPAGAMVIEAADTLLALNRVARSWRLRFPAPLLAVTGSMGKSSVKEMAAAVLSVGRRVVKNQGNFNNLIGLPLTLLKIEADTQAVVAELGVNRIGEMEVLVDTARPEAGLITNVAPVHLEGFGSLEGILQAKTGLWRGLKPGGTAVVNLDDPLLAGAGLDFSGPKVTFGVHPQAQVRLVKSELKADFQAGRAGLALTLAVEGREFSTFLPALGRFQARNALAACAGALALGGGVEDMAQGLPNYSGLAHRMRLLKSQKGAVILDDAYNANPRAMAEALATLQELKPAGVASLAVLAQMGELGQAAEAAHRDLGRVAAARLDKLIVLGPWAELTAQAARTAGLKDVEVAPDWAAAAELAERLARPGDWILIKGSRVAGLERVVAALTEAGLGEAHGA